MPEQLQRAINDYHALMDRDLDAADEQVEALRQMQTPSSGCRTT